MPMIRNHDRVAEYFKACPVCGLIYLKTFRNCTGCDYPLVKVYLEDGDEREI